MCGRFVLKATPAELITRFGLDECVDLKPRYNIPPGTNIAAIRQSPEGKRVLRQLHLFFIKSQGWRTLVCASLLDNSHSEVECCFVF